MYIYIYVYVYMYMYIYIYIFVSVHCYVRLPEGNNHDFSSFLSACPQHTAQITCPVSQSESVEMWQDAQEIPSKVVNAKGRFQLIEPGKIIGFLRI